MGIGGGVGVRLLGKGGSLFESESPAGGFISVSWIPQQAVGGSQQGRLRISLANEGRRKEGRLGYRGQELSGSRMGFSSA